MATDSLLSVIPVAQPETLVEYYKSFRSAIFTSSLTLGTFLFTMKTFIVQHMKKEVYDTPIYQEEVQERIRRGKKETLYGPLLRLKNLLFWAIVVAILNSLIQVTVGYIPNRSAAAFCFGSTAVSWLIVGVSLVEVTRNISVMLKHGEKVWNRARENEEKEKGGTA